jgi:hypothetical protein
MTLALALALQPARVHALKLMLRLASLASDLALSCCSGALTIAQPDAWPPGTLA